MLDIEEKFELIEKVIFKRIKDYVNKYIGNLM